MSTEIQNQVITFYSYKGGTGRTMALANVACLLAKQAGGKGVLMIDWDLEAPGLHRFFQDKFTKLFSDTNDIDRAFDEKDGLIDLFYELDKAITKPQNEDEASALLDSINLDQFILETDIKSLHLLKAGRFDEQYASHVNDFNWVKFYNRSPSIFRLLAERLTKHFQYVLIDSRTGITDISGICTNLMPDKLVVVFTPNRQSLTGLIDLIRKATKYRTQSDDLRPLSVFPLPSRIETAEPTLREDWRHGNPDKKIVGYQSLFEKLFKDIYSLPECNLESYFDEVQIQHVPRYAYGEEIAVLVERSGDRLSLTRSYESFTKSLVNLSGPWEYISETDVDENSKFDVFFSYDRRDIDIVERIAEQIRERGILPWLDVWEIRPGTDWHEQILEARRKANVFVIFIGGTGITIQQNNELISFRAVASKDQIIPVILKNAVITIDDLPFILKSRHSLDLRKISDDEAISQLIWGITGKRPDKVKDETSQDRPKVKLVSTIPATGGEIAANSSITVTFDKAMKSVTVNGSAATVSGKTAVWKSATTLTPGPVTLTIDGTSIDGGVLATATVALTAIAPDTTPPNIVGASCSPQNGATGVDPAKVSSIRIVFTEAMGSAKVDSFEPADAKIDSKMTDDKTLTISFLGGYKLGNEMEVKVKVSGSDKAGNILKRTSYGFATMKRDG